MGHMIDYFEFKKTGNLKEDKNTIYGEVSEWGEYESDARDYHGNLKFKTDTVFDNREKAKEYLERYEGKYEDVAVIYKEFEDKETVKIKRLKEKVKTLAKQREEYKQEFEDGLKFGTYAKNSVKNCFNELNRIFEEKIKKHK